MVFTIKILADSGKLVTWGSSDDQGQSYLASGKHGVIQLTFFVVLMKLKYFPDKFSLI